MLSTCTCALKTPRWGPASRRAATVARTSGLNSVHSSSASCLVPVSPCTTQRRLLCDDDLGFDLGLDTELDLDLELPMSLADLNYSELDQLQGLLEARLESLSLASEVALQAHGSAVTTLAWLNDTTLLSAGMDKTVCFVEMDGDHRMKVAKRIVLSGGPVHSVHPSSSGVIMGLHSKSLLELVSPPSSAFLQDMQYSVLESNLCGWPRDLTSNGTSLFSASCNEIRQFDTATKKSKVYKLDRGDILSLACTKDKLFAGTVDGSLFAFAIDSKTGALELRDARPKAHGGRITDLHIHKGMLMSGSYDGTVKSWCLDGLEIVAMASTKNGARILALAQARSCERGVEEGGYLYAAGSDGVIRVFDPIVLDERGVIVPPGLDENEGIRKLATNGRTLVAATSSGRLIVC